MAVVDSAIALVTFADVKEYLKIASGTTSEDSILGFFINEISKLCNSYTGRHLLEKTYTEFYNGSGTSKLILNQYPIISVTLLNDDPNRDFASGDNISVSADVLVQKDAGILELWNTESAFLVGRSNVKVTYSAGFAVGSVPQDIQLAVKRWIAVQYYKFTNKRHEVRSETVGDTTTTFIDQGVPEDAKLILDNYVRHGEAPDFSFAS